MSKRFWVSIIALILFCIALNTYFQYEECDKKWPNEAWWVCLFRNPAGYGIDPKP